MSTIFTKIINREIPGQFVYEDDVCVVLMDKFPSVTGQVLVIPKQESDYAFDLPDDVYQHIFAIAKKVSKALDAVYETERTCLIVEGFEVPHVHIKLYPVTNAEGGLAPIISKTTEAADETLEQEAARIRVKLSTWHQK